MSKQPTSEAPVQFAPLRREPVYLKVSRAIEENIVEGVLAEGEALPKEADLCAQFQVTRSTVREGLRLLEQTGLIARGAHKRFYVQRPSPSSVAEAASRGLALGGVTFNEVWDALAVYYPQAAGLAATRLTAGHLTSLERVLDALRTEPVGDHEATVRGAVAFFEELAKGLQNRVMRALLQSLNLLIAESLRQVIADTPKAKARILTAQQNILAALIERDEAGARDWMAKHIADLKRGYLVAKVDLDSPVL